MVEGLSPGPQLDRLLADEVEDHREVVDAERPKRVLVLADLPEVLPVAVDVEDVAELAGLDQLPELRDRGVVEEEVAGEEDGIPLLRERSKLVGFRAAEAGGFSTKTCFPAERARRASS